MGEFLKLLLNFDMTGSKVVELSVNFHKFNQKFLDEKAEQLENKANEAKESAAKEQEKQEAAEALKALKDKTLTKTKNAEIATTKKAAVAEAAAAKKDANKAAKEAAKGQKHKKKTDHPDAPDKKQQRLLGDEDRDMWKEISDARDKGAKVGSGKQSFWNELVLVTNEAVRGLDDVNDKVLAGAFACRPMIMHAIKDVKNIEFSQLYSSTLDRLISIKKASEESGKADLDKLTGKDIGALLLKSICPHDGGKDPAHKASAPTYDQSVISTFCSFLASTTNVPPKRVPGIKNCLEWIWVGGRTQIQ